MLQNKKHITLVSFILILLTIFTFSVVLAADDSVYVWSNASQPLTNQITNVVNNSVSAN